MIPLTLSSSKGKICSTGQKQISSWMWTERRWIGKEHRGIFLDRWDAHAIVWVLIMGSRMTEELQGKICLIFVWSRVWGWNLVAGHLPNMHWGPGLRLKLPSKDLHCLYVSYRSGNCHWYERQLLLISYLTIFILSWFSSISSKIKFDMILTIWMECVHSYCMTCLGA